MDQIFGIFGIFSDPCPQPSARFRPQNSIFDDFWPFLKTLKKQHILGLFEQHSKNHFFYAQHARWKTVFHFCTQNLRGPTSFFKGGYPPPPPFKNRFVATSNFGQRALSIVWFGDILSKVDMGPIKNLLHFVPSEASRALGQ